MEKKTRIAYYGKNRKAVSSGRLGGIWSEPGYNPGEPGL